MRPGEVGAVRFDRERDPDLDPDLDPDPHPDLEPDRVPRGAAGGAAITNRRSPGNMQSGARIFGPAPAVDAGAPPPSVLVQMDEKAEQVDALFAKADKAVKEENWDDCFGTIDKILRLESDGDGENASHLQGVRRWHHGGHGQGRQGRRPCREEA